MLNEKFIILGALISLVGSTSYVIDTIKGKIKPNRVSHFIWALAPMIAFAAQIQKGVGLSSLMTFMSGFLPLMTFIASFFNKKAEWKLNKFDLACGLFSIIGLVLWWITKEGVIAIIFSIISDGLASLPTIVKSFRYPETESALAYLTGSINSGLTLLTLKTWDITNAGFPIYIFVVCVLVFILIQFKIGKKFKFVKNSI